MKLKFGFLVISLTLFIVCSLVMSACSEIPANNPTILPLTPETSTRNTVSTLQATDTPAVTPPTSLSPTPKPSSTRPVQPVFSPTVSALPEGWQLDWLQGKPCRLPCWEWLQPGATNVDEAVVILNQYPLVEGGSIKFQSGTPTEYNSVRWKWKGQNYGGSFTYEANTERKLLTFIAIDFQGPFKLKDIIQAYGEPSHIDARGTDSIDSPGYFYSLDLIWEKQGLMVPFNQGEQAKPALTAEMNTYTWQGDISFINIVPPGNISNFKFGGYADTIRPWQGFKPFSFYCHDYHTGKPCP